MNCIYCTQSQCKYTREHVIPEAFGVFKNNFVLHDLVCEKCNSYFGETIVFDASDSYDIDGKIEYYSWDFGNGEKSEGKIVEHTYKFENDFEITYPLIYPISLFVKDNNDSMIGTNHQIKIFPN